MTCGLAFFSIAFQALYDPQLIMDLVQNELTNINSRNSIRAFYGGVNLAFGGYMLYSSSHRPEPALILLVLYTGGFFLGRIVGFFSDGTLVSPFIISWTIIEFTLFSISLILLRKLRKHTA
ncbi:MAG TPA: DUF4345 domain-containing protein [Sphingobacteriaceae bacterium]